MHTIHMNKFLSRRKQRDLNLHAFVMSLYVFLFVFHIWVLALRSCFICDSLVISHWIICLYCLCSDLLLHVSHRRLFKMKYRMEKKKDASPQIYSNVVEAKSILVHDVWCCRLRERQREREKQPHLLSRYSSCYYL